MTYIYTLNINNKFQILIKNLFDFDIITETFLNSSYAHINNILLLLLNHLRDLQGFDDQFAILNFIIYFIRIFFSILKHLNFTIIIIFFVIILLIYDLITNLKQIKDYYVKIQFSFTINYLIYRLYKKKFKMFFLSF